MQVVFSDPNRPRIYDFAPDIMSRRHVLSVYDHPDLVRKEDRAFDQQDRASLSPAVWEWIRSNFQESRVNICLLESHVRLDFETSEQATLFSLFVMH